MRPDIEQSAAAPPGRRDTDPLLASVSGLVPRVTSSGAAPGDPATARLLGLFPTQPRAWPDVDTLIAPRAARSTAGAGNAVRKPSIAASDVGPHRTRLCRRAQQPAQWNAPRHLE